MMMARKVTVGLFAIITIVGLGFGVYGMTYAYNTKIQQPTELWNYTCGDTISEIAISEDGNYIAVASFDGNLYFFNKDGQLLWTKNFGNYYPVSVDLTAYGTYIFVAAGTTVYLYRNDGTDLGSFDTTGDISFVDITPDGKYAVSIGDYIDFFNLTSGSMPTLYQWYANYYSDWGKITDDGSYVITQEGSKVYLFEGKGYTPLNPIATPNTPLWEFSDPANGYIEDVDISEDGTYIAVGTNNYRLHLLNNDGTLKWTYVGNDCVWGVSISYDNQYVAAVIGDSLYLFSTSSNTPLWEDNIASYYKSHMTFCKDANIIIASGTWYADYIWYYIWAKDVNNNTLWASTAEYYYGNIKKSVSGDGQYFAGSDLDNKVHFLGPPYTLELTAYYIPLSIIAMVAVISLFFKKHSR